MKYRVRLAAQAENDVETVLAWFRDQQAIAAGERWLTQLLKKIDTLETNPDRCSPAAETPELGFELRELLFGRRRGTYRILFEIRGQFVHILHIRHSARDDLSAGDL